MIAFIVCLLNLISIFFEINYIIILGLNPSLTPSLVPLMYLWWILLSDIIIQIGLAVVNILYLLWSMLTCCAAKENTLLKFGIMKSITIFYFISFCLIVLVFVIYRIILCYKKRNEPKYSHLVSDENHIEINLLENN